MKRFLLLALFLAPLAFAQAQAPEMEVVLIGTGYPRPDPERAGPSTAVRVGERVYLVDAGRGVMMRLAASGLPWRSITRVFLTHLHSDHTSGLPDLFTSTWIFDRETPLEVYGPEGVAAAMQGLERFFAADIRIRRDLTEKNAAAGARIAAHTVRAGVVYRDADVTITAFEVDHAPVKPAFGYRFDSHGRTVVISGDCRPTPELIRQARGADVLVHEVYLPEHFDKHDDPQVAARLKRYHTSADEVGEVARGANPKLLVLTHVIPADGEAEILRRAARHFSGKIVVGKDLMRFPVGQNQAQ
jgi:ribonuclease Z